MIKRIKAAISAFLDPDLLNSKVVFSKEKINVDDSALLSINSNEFPEYSKIRVQGKTYVVNNVLLEITRCL